MLSRSEGQGFLFAPGASEQGAVAGVPAEPGAERSIGTSEPAPPGWSWFDSSVGFGQTVPRPAVRPSEAPGEPRRAAGAVMDRAPALGARQVSLLLRCAKKLQAVSDEQALARTVLASAAQGTGLTNAALLRPTEDWGELGLIASRGEIAGDGAGPRLSRSLLVRAAAGEPVRLDGGPGSVAASCRGVAALNIADAVCVPLNPHQAVAAYLYLDVRGPTWEGPAAGLEKFAAALGELAAMAWANLLRRDIEHRYHQVATDLEAASRAQRLLLPERRHEIGPFVCLNESRPGRTMSGDFLDAIRLDHQRLAVMVGDVTGKGAAASVLMSLCQGFLNARLGQQQDLASVVADLNQYVEQRGGEQPLVTLWVAILDPLANALHYVDAGHGYAARLDAAGHVEPLQQGGGMPIGAMPGASYQTATHALYPGDTLLIASDGAAEQTAPAGGDGAGEALGWSRLLEVFRQTAHHRDPVAALFDTITDHAGQADLSDDTTIGWVRYQG